MAKIDNYAVFNFSGGVRRDKSPFETQKNELLDARNVWLSENGRAEVRKGSQQVGHTLSGNIENSFAFDRVVVGSASAVTFVVNNNASPAVFNRLVGSRLTGAVVTSDTIINVNDSSQFAASGTVEIDGDLIAYTGTGVGTLTGVTGITSTHSTGAAVHQWSALTMATAVDGRQGVYYAVINNALIINGRAAGWNALDNNDGTTMSAITGEPSGIFITNYRDRVYVAGDGGIGTNGDPRRVSFSARANGTSWTTATDYFDVEDQYGERISGLKVLNDRLNIFKPNSVFTYDEAELKQRLFSVGAWNHKVIREIGGLMYTFCPNGIFVTNGLEAKDIGQPVKQYWKNFQARFDSVVARTVINTFAGQYENHYLLYIGDITDPDSINDVVLVYDTIKQNWKVHTGGFTDFWHFGSFEKFRFGDRGVNIRPALFGGDSSGRLFRFFENRYVDGQATPVNQGTDIFQDLVSDTGAVISSFIETSMHDLTHPELYKRFGKFRGYAERGYWQVQYRVQNEKGISAYRPLGLIKEPMDVLTFPKEAEGWKIGFRIANVSIAHSAIFNGFVLEDTEAIPRK